MEFLSENTSLPDGVNVYPWMAVRADSVKCNSFTQLNPSNKGIIRYFGSNRDLVMTPVVIGLNNPVYVANEVRYDHSEGSE